MKKAQQLFLILVFGCLLLIPVLNDYFSVFRFKRDDENRKYADSLSIDIARLDKFPKGCEAYINDNFSFRTPLINLYRKTKLKVFHVSPFPDRMIVGKNGRYFMGGEEQQLHNGERNLNEYQLADFDRTWKRRMAFFDSLGIAVYVMPAPTSTEIYAEELPMNMKRNAKIHRFDQLEQHTAKSFPGLFVNTIPDLKAAKKKGLVYFKLDHHWTELGGYVASKKVLKRIKKERIPDLDLSFMNDYHWETETRDAGFFASILVDGSLEKYPVARGHKDNAEIRENLPLDYNSDNVSDYDKQSHYINPKAKNKKRLLVIRDSFGVATYPFLKEAFYESVFIHDSWQYGLNRKVMLEYRPDVVIYILYDPYLERITNPVE